MIAWLRQSCHRMLSLFRRAQLDHELDAELAAHLELAIEENIQRGMPPGEARRQVLIRFGGTEQAIERHRESRGLPALDILRQDLGFAIRQSIKTPGFTTAAVLTLALGIAVNATMFSMVSAFLLQTPPGSNPQRIVVVSAVSPDDVFQPDIYPVSAPNYLAWREANHVFADTAAADQNRIVSLTSRGQSEAIRSAVVSPNFFSVLGVSPEFGRTFFDKEDQPGSDHVVILSHEIWDRQFGSDASLIGRTIRLNREDFTVIGVMPANFRLLGYTPKLYTPLVLTAADQTAAAHKNRSMHLFARLKPAVSLDQARAELTTLARRAQQDFPETEKGWGASVRTLPDFLIHDFGIGGALTVLMTTVGFVLMIACANVAGLLLARAGGRRKELAIRISLGATRLRIIRQLLTEGLVIALLGGSIGVLFAFWGINFTRANLVFNEAISAVPLSLDRNVLFFAVAVSLISAVLCGLAPALQASRTDINTNLNDESRAASPGQSQSRLRTVLVTGEIALALFLLIGTGHLIRGIFLIDHQNLGFQADHLLTARVTLDNARYKEASQQARFVQDLLPRIQHLPGAQAVAVASDLPATGPDSITLRIKDQPELPANQSLSALDAVVTADYFPVAGIPLLAGRAFTDRDNANAPRVILVNQEFVHRYLQAKEPLGQQVRLDVTGAKPPQWNEIIGVVGNVKTYTEDTRDEPQVYEPFLQRPVSSFSLMIRTTSDPNALASALRNAVAQIDTELPLARVMSMPAQIERQRGGNTFFIRVLGSFAILALILAAIGIYGLIAYSVGQRTHEIGIRMALGAKNSDVLRMILWEGVKMTAVGAAVGLAMALPLPRIFDAMFVGLHFREPQLYFIVPVAIFLVALLATYIPARRASSMNPMSALRGD